MARRTYPARRTGPATFRAPSRVAFLPRMRSHYYRIPTSLSVGSATGSGGVEVGGSATVAFKHAGSVASDIVLEWDLDNDGDFSAGVEDITSYALSMETFTGRDWPSNLTGAVSPGRLVATLRNDDDRFSYFNSASPLATSPFSLKTGRRLRVRASGTSSPDPALLAKDRFRRADGALGSEEGGLAWSGPLANDFTITSQVAVATNDGNPHIAIVDTTSADYYVQVHITVVGVSANRVGIVYRYVDSDDYSLLVVDRELAALQLINVVAGVETVAAGLSIEVYDGANIGVLVESTTATAYLEGVPLFSGTAINTSSEIVGMYAEWAVGDNAPQVDNFFAWDGLTSELEGIIWTGDVSDLTQTVTPGPEKLVTLQGAGWLSKMATQTVTPPTSITGRKTGLLLGNVLAESYLIHPPGSIAQGDITTGPFAMDATNAIEVARRVEETEFGFLYETQEGPVAFDDRTARDGTSPVGWFSDVDGAQFGYHRINPMDWRREVFNQVTAGVSPYTLGAEAVLFTDPGPYVLTSGQSQTLTASYDGIVANWAGHARDVIIAGTPSGISVATQTSSGASTFSVSLPATVNAGDLLIVLFTPGDGTGWDEDVPTDWDRIVGTGSINLQGIAKVADGTEDGATIALSTVSGNAHWVAHIYRVTSWYGALSGVEDSVLTYRSNEQPNPEPITPSWGAVPTLFLAAYSTSDDVSQSAIPSGYTLSTFATTSLISLGSAHRVASTTTEDTGAFTISQPSDVNEAVTIAIRGPITTTPVTATTPTGANPSFTISYDNAVGGTTQSHENIEVSGRPLLLGDVTSVTGNDTDSQDDHNAIRTYRNPANLFATTGDATSYNELVLATHADDRPILSISYYANKSAGYRKQALRRRLSDKITLVADGNAGLGIDQDFFIESINHRWSNGTRLWEVTYELSPA